MNNLGKDKDFHNYIDFPAYNNAVKKGNRPVRKRNYPFNATGGYNMCCGLAATGDEAAVTTPAPIVPETPKIHNMKAWGYAKTGLAIVGLYVIGMYLYKKYKK